MRNTKGTYTKQEAKQAFIQSMYNFLTNTLNERDIPNCFRIEGSSIFIDMPTDYFTFYDVPEGTKIEMKFVAKK